MTNNEQLTELADRLEASYPCECTTWSTGARFTCSLCRAVAALRQAAERIAELKAADRHSLLKNIRAALKDADRKGKLGVVSAITGSSIDDLREIMNSKGELNALDRGMLAIHLGLFND